MGGGGMNFARGLALGSNGPGGGGAGANRGGLATSEEDFGKAFDPRVIGRLWRYAAPYKKRIMVGIVLLLVYGISQGAKLVAGEEEAGTLELELTAPVTRTGTYVERLVALWLGLLTLVAAVSVTMIVLSVAIPLDLSGTNILATGALMWLAGGLFATLALAVGATTGRRSIGLGVGAGAAVLMYAFNALGPLTGWSWMTTVSPFDWYLGADPLATGMDAARAALLLGCSALFAAAGYVGIGRRDLMV